MNNLLQRIAIVRNTVPLLFASRHCKLTYSSIPWKKTGHMDKFVRKRKAEDANKQGSSEENLTKKVKKGDEKETITAGSNDNNKQQQAVLVEGNPSSTEQHSKGSEDAKDKQVETNDAKDKQVEANDAKDKQDEANSAPWEPPSDVSVQQLETLMHPAWRAQLADEFKKPYFAKLKTFLSSELKDNPGKIFPPLPHVFEAFNRCPIDKVKVVILGQDPYHGAGQAHGLCFSVNKGVTVPPSLKNMYKELATDVPGFKAPKHGYLLEWADQGVFLLNTVLTVR